MWQHDDGAMKLKVLRVFVENLAFYNDDKISQIG